MLEVLGTLIYQINQIISQKKKFYPSYYQSFSLFILLIIFQNKIRILFNMIKNEKKKQGLKLRFKKKVNL